MKRAKNKCDWSFNQISIRKNHFFRKPSDQIRYHKNVENSVLSDLIWSDQNLDTNVVWCPTLFYTQDDCVGFQSRPVDKKPCRLYRFQLYFQTVSAFKFVLSIKNHVGSTAPVFNSNKSMPISSAGPLPLRVEHRAMITYSGSAQSGGKMAIFEILQFHHHSFWDLFIISWCVITKISAIYQPDDFE